MLRRPLLGLSLGLCLVAGPVRAEDDPDLAVKETARQLFVAGDAAFQAGNYEEALKNFAAADEYMGLPTTGLERARTLAKLGRLLEATDRLQKITRGTPAPDENEVQRTARREAETLLEEVRPIIPSLKVVVRGVRPGVDVQLVVDGIEVPPSAQAFPHRVDPGHHDVSVAAAGYQTEKASADLDEGDNQEIVIDMRALAPDEPALDPWAASQSPAEADDGGSVAGAVLLWTGYGVGAVGVVVGTITGVMSILKTKDLEKRCDGIQCPDDVLAERDDALPIAHVSTASFVVGGAGIVVGTIGLLLMLSDSSPEDVASLDLGPVRVTPWASPTGAGLSGVF
ncbi:MAG: hypothetical protein R3B72_00025 [Polyangiaceae bacterium]